MLVDLIERFGYLVIFVGTFFEGETVLVFGGFAAHQGHLTLAGVIVTAFLGSYAGDQVWFHLARRYGRLWLARRPKLLGRVERVRVRLGGHADWFVLTFRFLYGIRSVGPMALAMSGYPARRFLALNGIAAAVWAIVVGTAGYLFGEAFELMLGQVKDMQIKILGAIAAAVVAALIGHWLYRRWLKRQA
ncbi:DedA family protein [Desertibaculum subflavum]|uniref:DedA family protein n=1 Tax=Desertibaculum subflavum TaxID=2268458 RepID=UPI000E664EA6